jgi:hypothetical protein
LPPLQIWAPKQPLPQPPQLTRSVWVFAQAPLQSACPEAQEAVQAPLEQTPASQALPHDPQLFGSLAVFAQVPLHEVWPAGQTQTPLEHANWLN